MLLLSNIVLGCTFYTNRDGAAGFDCYKGVLTKEMTDAIIYSGEDFDSRYLDCLQRR